MAASERVTGLLEGLDLPLPEDPAVAVLELGFLMSAVDGHLADEELDAFRALATALRPNDDPNDLLERFVVAAHTVGVDHRVRHVAEMIPTDLRAAAFKVAVGLSLVDDEQNEHEDELVGILGAALGLAERTITLTREARAALGIEN
jgi:hypothetical protein